MGYGWCTTWIEHGEAVRKAVPRWKSDRRQTVGNVFTEPALVDIVIEYAFPTADEQWQLVAPQSVQASPGV
jgi:hypothetical protein